MKAILVVDIPDDIWANKEEDLGMYAEVWSRKVGDGWCGEYYSSCLKPMPQKKQVNTDFIGIGDYDFDDTYNAGWNACIDEILGDTE